MSAGRLEAVDVECTLAGRTVLTGFSLAMQSGEVVAVVGPNGAGKTTLLRSLSRLLRPARGRVLLDGQDLWTQSSAWSARRIAFLPQQQTHEWPFTVEEFVGLGRLPHRGWWRPLAGNDKTLIHHALDRLALADQRHRLINQLSGGEWQRVRLAQALAQQPELLLLDEPTTHLDLRFQIAMLDLVRELAHRDGLGIIVTMHDLNQAGQWADRLALLDRGRLFASGSANEVLSADNVQAVYNVAVTVQPHPVFGTPFITPLKELK